MSLINDVLRDLDERRRREGRAPGSVLAGLRPAAVTGTPRGARVSRAIVGCSGLLVAGLALSSFSPSPVPQARPVPAATGPAPEPDAPAFPVPAVSAFSVPERPARAQPRALSAAPLREPAQHAVAAPDPPVPSVAEAPAGEDSGSADGARGFVEKLAHPATPRQLAERTYREALRLERLGDERAAREQLSEALGHMPRHRSARVALAMLLVRRGQLSEAGDLLDAGLEADPRHAPFAKLRARIMVEMGAVDDAVHLLERAAPPLTADPEHHAFLAALYQRQGNHDQAAQLYREVLRFDRRRPLWWMGLGISLEAEARPEKALVAYRGAQRIGGLDPVSRRFTEARIERLVERSE